MSILNESQRENYYIQNKFKKLEDMFGKVKEIKAKIQENIDKLNNNLKSLEVAMNTYFIWLVSIAQGNQDSNNRSIKELNEDIRTNSKLFFDSVINIYSNTNNDSSQFNDNQNFSQNRMDFFNAVNEGEGEGEGKITLNSIDGSITGKCCKCIVNKASCSYLNNNYCKTCINELINKLINEGKDPNFDDIICFDNKKDLFMSSFETLIKIILLKYNYILNNESKISINMENHMGKNIKRKFNYPIMKSDEYKDLSLMKDINSVLINDFNADFQNFSESNYNLINLNELIKASLRNIFNDEKIYKGDNIENIESNHMMEDDDLIYNQNLNNNDEIDEINLAEVRNENFVKNKKNQNQNSKSKTLENYYLLINLIYKKEGNLENEIIQAFNSNFSLNKDQILFSYNKSYFIDRIIRTEKFDNLSLSEIKKNYQYFDELYEFKYFIDELLITQCKIDKKLIDYKGHFIIPNKSNNFIRGKEKYYPPYGWIGIGLNVLGKYNDGDDWINDSSKESKWSIAYHGVGGNLPSSEVLKKLNKKIIHGLEDGESQYKCNYTDIRHKNKRIGTGVYLTPNIDIAENYSGEIKFNNSKYKIALMVKVLNDKIREPEDINFWILNKKYIRIYRVLIKKITE